MDPSAGLRTWGWLLAAGVLAGCDVQGASRVAAMAGEPTASMTMDAIAVSSTRSARDLPPEVQTASPGAPARRMIRSASARLEVEDLTASVDAARALAEDLGGYVAGSELREGREGARTASLTLRMPSDSVDLLVAALPDLGRVLATDVRAQEVTREYVDLETRLAVQEETVARLRALGARGGSLEELLAAEREVGRAVTELESLKGQMRSLSQRIAEADVRVTLFEPGAVVGSGAFRPLLVAFRDSGEVLARSLATLVYGVVFGLPWLIAAAFVVWALRRWWRGRAAVRESVS